MQLLLHTQDPVVEGRLICDILPSGRGEEAIHSRERDLGRMTLLYQGDLRDPETLSVHASDTEVVTWQSREALKLVDRLALIPDLEARDVSIEVWIGTEGPAYRGGLPSRRRL